MSSIYESRQKGDFIGSISHELRSPLHGILGSTEFLYETNFDAFQGSLVDTISSCGRTLLQTIEHILDYSKINSFERNWRNARKPKTGSQSSVNGAARRAVAKDASPLLSIYAVTDVAAIAEEVVEGIYAGQMFRDLGSADITDVLAGQRGRTSDRELSLSHQKSSKDIEVVLKIHEGDYLFTTQPGALRRVIMNVFGNSLKYTTAGKIAVSIRLEAPDKDKILDITITDTGKGISGDYLRTSLYTAFSQEDVLANGTGLGLSIVRSIVSMLEGTIDIKSEVNKGTEVHIRIPLSREAGSGTSLSTPSSVGSPDKLQENSITVLQTDHSSKAISIYTGSNPEQDTETCRTALYYIKEWFKLPIVSTPLERPSDVVIVEERDLPELLRRLRPGPAIVVLSTKTHPLQVIHSLYPGAIESMSKPFGPYKLAKSIRLSLEKADQIAASHTPQPRPTIQSPRESEDGTIIAESEPVTLETADEESPTVQLQTNGFVTASRSSNARIALGTSLSMSSTESRADFPFPSPKSSRSGFDSPRSAFDEAMKQASSRPKLSSRKTEPVLRPVFPHTSALTRQGQLATSNARDKTEGSPITPTTKQELSQVEKKEQLELSSSNVEDNMEKRQPRLLLVDDNKINLRLLETFMRKRKYQFVDSVEDGSQAVQAAKKHAQGYDIIFMVSFATPRLPSDHKELSGRCRCRQSRGSGCES